MLSGGRQRRQCAQCQRSKLERPRRRSRLLLLRPITQTKSVSWTTRLDLLDRQKRMQTTRLQTRQFCLQKEMLICSLSTTWEPTHQQKMPWPARAGCLSKSIISELGLLYHYYQYQIHSDWERNFGGGIMEHGIVSIIRSRNL